MPLQLWVRAASGGLRIVELPVPLIYLEEKRSFGGQLDDAATRFAQYHRVIQQSIDELSSPQSTCGGILCGEETG